MNSGNRSRDGAYRPCVAMVLFNAQGDVLVAERNDIGEAAWQIPQGGIDPGETPQAAALRELGEEIGTRAVTHIATAPDAVRYDWPENIPSRRWQDRYRGQAVTLIAFRFEGNDADIDLETAHPEFRDWRWVELELLPELITPFKKHLYEKAVEIFTPIRDALMVGKRLP